MMKKLRVPYHRQGKIFTCGPAALQMMLGYFKMAVAQRQLRRRLETSEQKGTSQRSLIKVATKLGFYCYVNDGADWGEIIYWLNRKLPVMVNYKEPKTNEGHFAVVTGYKEGRLLLNDPWNGRNFSLGKQAWLKRWIDGEGNHPRWLLVLNKEDLRLGKQYLPD